MLTKNNFSRVNEVLQDNAAAHSEMNELVQALSAGECRFVLLIRRPGVFPVGLDGPENVREQYVLHVDNFIVHDKPVLRSYRGGNRLDVWGFENHETGYKAQAVLELMERELLGLPRREKETS